MCIFCDIIAGTIPSRKVYEDDNVLAILDVNPLSKGHTLILPKKHTDSFLTADAETVQNLAACAHELAVMITERTGADGCNILTNCGEAAGQSVSHLHVHIIPRYNGDSAVSFEHAADSTDPDEVLKLLTK